MMQLGSDMWSPLAVSLAGAGTAKMAGSMIAHHLVGQPGLFYTYSLQPGSQERKSGSYKASESQGLEVPEHHFPCTLLAKGSHRASPDPRGEERDHTP